MLKDGYVGRTQLVHSLTMQLWLKSFLLTLFCWTDLALSLGKLFTRDTAQFHLFTFNYMSCSVFRLMYIAFKCSQKFHYSFHRPL